MRPDPAPDRLARRVMTLLLGAALLSLTLAVALAAAGCDMPSTGGLGQVGGSGVVVTQRYDYTGFTKVTVDNGFQVEIDYADTSSVSVSVDDNLVKEHLKVELDGDTLHIGLAPLWRYHDVTLRARVVMPRLTGLEVSGASSAVVTKFSSGDPLEIAASGSSDVDLVVGRLGKVALDVSGASRVTGEAPMDELDGDVSGGSVVELSGSATVMRLGASGGSRLGLDSFTVRDADLELSGGSRGSVVVTGTLNVDASGGSRLKYAGDPKIGSIDASGGSAVEPAGN